MAYIAFPKVGVGRSGQGAFTPSQGQNPGMKSKGKQSLDRQILKHILLVMNN